MTAGSKQQAVSSKRAEDKRMLRNISVFICLLLTVFLLTAFHAQAQQAKKVARIGYMSALSPIAESTRIESLKQGLHELGYYEGKNIVFEWRFGEGKPDRLSELASELVRLKVDVIVTAGSTSARAAKEATSTIPVVMVQVIDPVGSGLVASLARPGGNVTGLSTLSPEISGKQLELLKEILPRLSRVSVLGTSTNPGNAQSLRETELAGAAFGVQVQYLDVLSAKDIETAFRAASKGHAEAALVLTSPITFGQRTQLVNLAAKSRLPTVYFATEFVEEGGLITYSVSFTDLFRRAATHVDKTLKGAKPADLPVEQPTKFELVINLKTAKQIGLTIPQSMLYRADRVIK